MTTSVSARNNTHSIASRSADPVIGPPAPPAPSSPREVVGSVPEHFGATAMPTAKLTSPVRHTAADLELWPDPALEHQARALRGHLKVPADYPGREIDAANLVSIDAEMNRRLSARAPVNAAVITPKDAVTVEQIVKEACHEAEQLAHQFAHDAPMRKLYAEAVAERATRIVGAFERGEISAEQAAAEANAMRNEALGATRAELSPAGKLLSSYLKEQGLTLEQACKKYAGKLFEKPYAALSESERAAVLLEVAKKSGVTNAEVNALSKHAPKAPKVLLAVSVAIALYQVANAEDKLGEGVKQGGGFAGAWAGAKVGAAVGTWFCGLSVVGAPGAPACAVIGGLAGALGGAMLGEHLAEAGYEHVRHP